MILQLPKPTTANERLWPIQLEPKYQVFVNSLLEKNWWKHHGADWFQPLFGLTAKDTKGKVRTVVEGDIVFPLDFDLPRIIRYKNFVWCASVIVPFNGPIDNDLRAIHLDIRMGTILCHATDIVAAGNKLTCWECHGSGRVVSCPTCHGEGTFNIVWRE